MVVTALQFKISLEMCNKFRPPLAHLLPFWPMAQWLPGADQTMVVTALQFKISLEMCNKFRLRTSHSPRSWLMDQ
jgi:hypothetical protein